MKSLIDFEFRKIFKSRLFIIFFVIILISLISMNAVSLGQYFSGVAGQYALSDMQGEKIPETFVSKENIESFRKALEEFENREEIYMPYETWSKEHPEGGTFYSGKYDTNHFAVWTDYELGKITDKELEESLNQKIEYAIKPEYVPEYLKLLSPVDKYENRETSIYRLNSILESGIEPTSERPLTDEQRALYSHMVEKEEKELENGFTVGYDYGWENIFNFLSETGIFLPAIIVIGLCGVFTNEYTCGADALLLSSKNGKKKLTLAKIAASLIYSAVMCAAYILMTCAVSFAFLGIQGAGVGAVGETNLLRLIKIIPTIFLGCVLLSLIVLAISAATRKKINAVVISLIVAFLPMLITSVIYISNSIFNGIISAMPINMITGTYINRDEFIYLGQRLIDIKYMFIPSAVITIAVFVPVIFRKYCRHQVG